MSELRNPSEGVEETQSIHAGDVRLAFAWVDDRWVHALLVRNPEGQHEVAAHSVDWPRTGEQVATPVYQQVHIQTDGRRQTAFAVGQSGHHHFSATFTVVEDPDGVISVEVDVADRRLSADAADSNVPLACTYETTQPMSTLEEATHKFVRWPLRRAGGYLDLSAAPSGETPTIVVVSEADPSSTRAQPIARYSATATTQRCCYRWTREPGRRAP